jgi:tRNA threonylcarbamoyladenosine biosynthesis protein TsaB
MANTSSQPRIVAMETSGRQGSVAVALGEQLLAERELSPALRHAVELMPAVQQMTAAQGWGPDSIAQIYLSLGPGSFTGLRIAVAIARAMAQAIGCKVVGVPSLDVIAENAGRGPAEFGVVVPVLDAKRGEVFAARYERAGDGRLARTAGPALVDPRKFVMEAVEKARGGKVAVLGEGVEYHRAAVAMEGVVELDRVLWAGRASVVHRLGWERASRGEYSDPATLLPIYIRLPEAEEVWRKKQQAATDGQG